MKSFKEIKDIVLIKSGDYHGCGQQTPEDTIFIAELLEKEKPNTILEIGTGGGQFTTLLALMSKKVITVDQIINKVPFWQDIINKGKIEKEDVDITQVKGSSQIETTANKVKGKYDLVFIDADHSWEGGLADWRLYSPMAKSVIGIHDTINYSNKHGQGWDWFPTEFWAAIKSDGSFKTEEVDPDKDIGGGWGVIYLKDGDLEKINKIIESIEKEKNG